jgi:hypothetical protein
MAIKTTRYSPDTCGCVIEYSWDDSVTEDQRQHTLANYITKCPAHTGLPTDQDRWNAVFEENPRKNIAHQLILDNGPTALSDLINGTRQIKDGITFNTSWSGTAPDRVLTITVTGISLTQTQKNSIQTFLNNRFAGKVLIA